MCCRPSLGNHASPNRPSKGHPQDSSPTSVPLKSEINDALPRKRHHLDSYTAHLLSRGSGVLSPARHFISLARAMERRGCTIHHISCSIVLWREGAGKQPSGSTRLPKTSRVSSRPSRRRLRGSPRILTHTTFRWRTGFVSIEGSIGLARFPRSDRSDLMLWSLWSRNREEVITGSLQPSNRSEPLRPFGRDASKAAHDRPEKVPSEQ